MNKGVSFVINATIKLRGIHQIYEGKIDEQGKTVSINNKQYEIDELMYDVPVSGTVYGVLLNYKGAFKSFEPSMYEEPYIKPPKAPILYIKPRNTFTSFGTSIPLPSDASKLEIGASLGIVIGRTATKVKESVALEYIKGYTIVNDVTIPHKRVYRPAVKEKSRDGFCPIGPWIIDQKAIPHPDALDIRVYINGELKQENNTENLVRPVGKLIQDVTSFMTLYAGDILLAGVPENAPLAGENDRVKIEINGIGVLENTIGKENKVVGGG